MPKSVLMWMPLLGAAGYASGFLFPEPERAAIGAAAVVSPLDAPKQKYAVLSGEESLPRETAMGKWVAELESLDPEGLKARFLALVEGGENREKKREILLLLVRWAEIDPTHGLAFFRDRSATEKAKRNDAVVDFDSDELKCFRSVVKHADASGEPDALTSLRWLALSDPRGAIARASAGALNEREWGRFLYHLSRIDAQAVWEALPEALAYSATDDPFAVSSSWFDVSGLVHQDLDRLLESLAKTSGDQWSYDDSLFREIGESLPRDLDFLRKHLGEFDDPELMRTLIKPLVANGSFQWLVEGAAGMSEDSPLDRELLKLACIASNYDLSEDPTTLAEKVPEALLRSVFGESDMEDLPESSTGIAILLRLDPPVLPSWFAEDGATLHRAQLFPANFGIEAKSGPFFWSIPREKLPAVAELLASRSDLPPEKLSAFAKDWAGSDPAAAAQWLEGVPSEDARVAGARAVLENWAIYDLETSSRWVATLPAGAMRDSAISALAEGLVDYDHEAAATWVESIGDAGRREAARRTLAEEGPR